MLKTESKLPFFAQASLFFVGIIALFTILYIARPILVPLVFSLLIAIVLQPVVRFFVRKGCNRVVAIVITLFLVSLIFAAFGLLIFSQASQFGKSWPLLVEKLTHGLDDTIIWASGYFDTDPQHIREWIATTKSDLINANTAVIGKTLMSFGGLVMVAFLMPMYIFLILFYQPLLSEFILKLFGTSHQTQVREVVMQIKNVVQRYLMGLVIEVVIVAILNSVSLLILGIEYAILLGIIGALLNLIPYLGGLVGVALPMMVAFATKSSGWYAVYVLGFYYLIQLIDNNYIIPKIVASRVKINALFSIIVVIAGNALWGIPGMFLSIPLLAIVKLIFDQIETMKPWGFLLGDTTQGVLKMRKRKIGVVS